MIDQLTSGDVMPCLNQSFTLRTEEGALTVELVEVTEHSMPRGGEGEDTAPRTFSMVFAAPADTAAPQQVFALENERLGRLELFLVPVGPLRDGRMAYQAVLA